MLVQAPAEPSIDQVNGATFEEGKLSLLVPPAAKGFQVTTIIAEQENVLFISYLPVTITQSGVVAKLQSLSETVSAGTKVDSYDSELHIHGKQPEEKPMFWTKNAFWWKLLS